MSRSPEMSQNPEYLDPREAAEWFPYTFYFSQGGRFAQLLIISYLKVKRPNQVLSPSFEGDIRKMAGPEIAKLVLTPNHQAVRKSDLPVAIVHELWVWKSIFDTGIIHVWQVQELTPEKREKFLDMLLREIISRDYEWYVTNPKGRKPGPLNDPDISHVVHYIVHAGRIKSPGGNPKYELEGLPVIFQEMFTELRIRLTRIVRLEKENKPLDEREKEVLEQVKFLIYEYNRRHRSTPASLDDLLKD